MSQTSAIGTAHPSYHIGAWGPPSAGKTVYLGALYGRCNMRRDHELMNLEWHIDISDPVVLGRIQPLAEALEGRGLQLVDKTTSPEHYDFHITGYGSYWLGRLEADVRWHDLPGDEMITRAESLYAELRECQGILCFIDPKPDLKKTGFSSPDGFYLSRLDELFQRAKPIGHVGDKLPQVFAFVVTKADSDGDLWSHRESPTAVLESIVGDEVTGMIEGACKTSRIFVSSSVGAIVDSDDRWRGPNLETERSIDQAGNETIYMRKKNLRARSFNVVPPIRWMLEQLKSTSPSS
jgi:hypothetical protein